MVWRHRRCGSKLKYGSQSFARAFRTRTGHQIHFSATGIGFLTARSAHHNLRTISFGITGKLGGEGGIRTPDSEFRSVVEHLPEYLKDFAGVAYYTGMRKSEIASLRWEDVDGGMIRLRAEHAKTGEARSVPIEGELAEL